MGLHAVPPFSISQAGQACVCRSQAWDAKIVTSAWWVHASQVCDPQSSCQSINLILLIPQVATIQGGAMGRETSFFTVKKQCPILPSMLMAVVKKHQ